MKRYISLVAVLCLCCLICLSDTAQSQGEKERNYQVVSMLVDKITPSSATIERGTTVIWVNESPGPVEIQFINTESIIAACESPLRFVKDSLNQYVSDKIPFAGVASICFIQNGTFKYIAARGDKKISGEIIVK